VARNYRCWGTRHPDSVKTILVLSIHHCLALCLMMQETLLEPRMHHLLLSTLVLCSIAISVKASPPTQDEAVAAIKKLGGSIVIDANCAGKARHQR